MKPMQSIQYKIYKFGRISSNEKYLKYIQTQLSNAPNVAWPILSAEFIAFVLFYIDKIKANINNDVNYIVYISSLVCAIIFMCILVVFVTVF